MNQPLRIAVADDEQIMLQYYRKTLAKLGHQVVIEADNGRTLVDECLAKRPDLVIADIRMPELDGIAASEELCKTVPTPVVLVSAFHDPESISRALNNHVLAYLVKPIKQADLETTIAIAKQRHEEFLALHHEAENLRQALEDRKLVERAKGALMKRAQLDEPAAFRRMQKIARDKNLKLVEVARTILTAEEAYRSDR